MKSIMKIATIAAGAIALTAGTASARDEFQPMKLHYGRGQTVTLWGTERPTKTIGFFSRGSGIGERMTWQGREMTQPVLMHDAHGHEFVLFRTNR
jgi:hypothetical protein